VSNSPPLSDLVAQRAALDRAIARAVAAARKSGATWTDLAAELGVSRQAATKKYGRRIGGAA